MISSVRPCTSAWSLPWMALRYKAFSRDGPIIPLISKSGNALGFRAFEAKEPTAINPKAFPLKLA
jgi:hypothetical protein